MFIIHYYGDVIIGAIASQITSLTIVYSTVYSDADRRKHQSSASLAFVWGIHRRPVNSPHKWPVTRKMFPFDDVIMMGRADSRIPTLNSSVCIFSIQKHVVLMGNYYPTSKFHTVILNIHRLLILIVNLFIALYFDNILHLIYRNNHTNSPTVISLIYTATIHHSWCNWYLNFDIE